jgi:glutamine amidotransferase
MNGRRLTLVDFGMGNLFNLERAVRYLGHDIAVTSDPKTVASADRLILPGVGSFPRAMEEMEKRGLLDGVRNFLVAQRPLLGVCLGMQILFSRSFEFGEHEGLGAIKGNVVRFRSGKAEGNEFKVPQVGWNTIQPSSPGGKRSDWQEGILAGIAAGTPFYFVHSFFCRPEDPSSVVAETSYGGEQFCSVVKQGTIWGASFTQSVVGETVFRS